ncbi:MAG: DUF1302 domain-containing protein [Candidatus Omnitrophica bacterium]|nr:DUF1302 domain-containing protein [Candidatus Omnitrophota bacterium]
MRKILTFFIGGVLFLAQAVSAGEFSYSGYLKNELSLGLETEQLTKFKNIFQISGQYVFNDNFVAFVTAKYWYDSVYDWYERYDPAQHYMGHIQRNDWLRDCYLDYMNGPWFLRLGKQQVSWGQADGIAILDRVNPVDLSEYWLPDAVDLRIPLWMANINYSPKLNSNLQLLIIPDFEQSTAAPPSAPFTFRSYKLFMDFKKFWEMPPIPVIKPFYGVLNTDIYYPSKKPEHTKIGVQWQDRISDWDYTLNYLYGYDYLARTYLDSMQVIPPVGPPWYPTLIRNYSRRFKLVQMVGGSLNHTFTRQGPLKGITFRADAAVYMNEPTYYGDASTGASYGVNRWDNVFWLIGLDRYIFTKWLVSFQFAQYIMQDAKPGIDNYQTLNSYTNGAQDQVENIFSLKISTHFMNDKLKPEVLWSFTDDNQGRVSPKINYEIRDNLVFTLGFHYFYGNVQDSNGQFRDCNQVYTMLKFSF